MVGEGVFKGPPVALSISSILAWLEEPGTFNFFNSFSRYRWRALSDLPSMISRKLAPGYLPAITNLTSGLAEVQ